MNRPDNDEIIGDFCRRLEKCLAESPFSDLRRDFKSNARAVGESLLGRADIVSRAEFEAQNALLSEALQKLAAIQEQLGDIERQLAPKDKKPPL